MEEDQETSHDPSDHYGSVIAAIAGKVVNQAVEQMVQAIRNTDAYLEYQKQLARVKEQPELKRQIDEFRTRNFELQTSKDTNFDKLDQFTRENEAFRENPLVSDFLAAELAFCRMMQGIGLYVTDQMHFE